MESRLDSRRINLKYIGVGYVKLIHQRKEVICVSTAKSSDRDFLLRLMSSLLNLREQFQQDLKKVVGPKYFQRVGNIEAIDGINERIRDHLAENLQSLEDTSPGLIEEIKHLFDEYGPLGVEETVIEMRRQMRSREIEECDADD